MQKPQGFIPENWTWIQFEGPETSDFLQRLSTARVPALKPGHGTEACFLTPQGKLLAYFQLWCLDENAFAFEFDAGTDRSWEKSLLEFIDFYTFGEKFKVSKPRETIRPVWIFPKNAPALKENQIDHETSRHRDSKWGRPWLSVWSTTDFEPISKEKLESWRVLALNPSADAEIKKDSNPLEVGLRLAIADNKGCYPGQEVIEKIIALGAPARRLCLMEFTTEAPAPGSVLTMKGEEVGKITSSQATHALALLRKTYATPGLSIRSGDLSATILKVAPYEN